MNIVPKMYLITKWENSRLHSTEGGTSKHTPGLQKDAFGPSPKSVLHSSILILVMMLKFC